MKGKSPWARVVIEGEQVLLCPGCQVENPHWAEQADRCPNCSSSRLVVVLDTVICRGCGRDFERQ